MHRIVLAEYDRTALRLMTHILECARYDVTPASTGQEALYSIVEHPPSLLITDLASPGLGGLELIRGVRSSRSEVRKVPILVISGNSSKKLVLDAVRLGINDFVVETELNVPNLLDRVARLAIRPEGETDDEESTLVANGSASAAKAGTSVAGSRTGLASNGTTHGVDAKAGPGGTGAGRPVGHKSLPSPGTVASALCMLLGRKVEAASTQPLDLKAAGSHVFATYTGEAGQAAALAIAETSFAIRAGAALAAVPPAFVTVAVERQILPDAIELRFQEVAAICGSFFKTRCSAEVKFQAVYKDINSLPVEARALLNFHSERIDVEIQIAEYGAGKIAFLAE